jgi:multiple sugar transport system ATP-binding protein
LKVASGEVVTLVGPSGCGKSTTLRMVAGLERPDGGSIRIGERDMTHVPPQERDVAMVFQGFALYPHMTVREILAFPLKMRGVPSAEREKLVTTTAEMLAIARLLERRPGQLSGGEQQRVAMGRAIVRRPEVFLFDEPLSNLDAALRAELRVELGKLLRRLEATALYVTHDQAEAMTLSDRIAVMREGKLEQLGTPREIYERPASLFVASFFGSPPMNLVQVERVPDGVRFAEIILPAPSEGDLMLGFRPEHVDVVDAPSGPLTVRGVVSAREPHGAETHLEIDVAGQLLRARLPGFDTPGLGDSIHVRLDPGRLSWFSAASGRAVSV